MIYAVAVSLLAASAALVPAPGSAAVATQSASSSRGLLETEGSGSTISVVECKSTAGAATFAGMRSAHINVVADLVTNFCDNPDVDFLQVVDSAADFASAFAFALASAQAECVSEGNAFGCAAASATARAWASATASAHAAASSVAIESCPCLKDLVSVSFGEASTFVDLTAEVFVGAEAFACSAGDSASFAVAYSQCTAASYATIWAEAVAEAFIEGGCFNPEVTTAIRAATGAAFDIIENCNQDSFAVGDAFASTAGDAEGDYYVQP